MKFIKQLLFISFKKITILTLVFSIGFINSIEFKIDAQASNITSNPFESLDLSRENRIERIQADQSSTSTSAYRTNSISNLDNSQYFVKFKETVSFEVIARILTPYVYNMLGNSKHRTFAISTDDFKGLENNLFGLVEYIEKENEIKIASNSDDTYFTQQWGLAETYIPYVWSYTTGASDVYVCIIDTGLSRDHSDLSSNIFKKGWDYSSGGEVLDDPDGHGTMVAGIIGADTNNYIGIAGISSNTSIVPLKIPMIGEYYDTSKIIEAVYDAADSGCDIINMSLGGPSFSATFNSAIQYAYNKGSIIIASAGNSANEGNPINYPASYNNVISVGAVDDYLYRSDFSNYNNYVDVVAPGEDILTTNNQNWYSYASGTSFSAPHVAGIAALIKSVKPDLTTNMFMDLIKTTSGDYGTYGYDIYYGYGLIDAASMLNKLFKPTQPTGLNAQLSNDESSITLNWNKTTNAIYYDVYKSIGNNYNFSRVARGISENSFIDNALLHNTQFYYKVVGYNSINDNPMYGNYSSILKYDVPVRSPIVSLTEVDSHTFQLSWNPVPDRKSVV